jgi:hypothetical protein
MGGGGKESLLSGIRFLSEILRPNLRKFWWGIRALEFGLRKGRPGVFGEVGPAPGGPPAQTPRNPGSPHSHSFEFGHKISTFTKC